MTTVNVHPVDAVLPPGQMFLVGLQHVLVMYAGAIVVPLIVGGALKLPTDQLALLATVRHGLEVKDGNEH